MEEVWKDINLATLNDKTSRPTSAHPNLGGVMFQDFLARPFSLDPPNSILSSASAESASLYCPAASPAPPLVTALSLNSRPDLHFDALAPKPSQPHHHASSNVSCFTDPSPLHSLASVNCLGTKRFAEPAPDCSQGDRRNKRMIKNRESAARSRARKQENIASFFRS
ncbi:FD protein [Spatholobus suberectus]|nr:FD protein [Spatholobus suberectus]